MPTADHDELQRDSVLPVVIAAMMLIAALGAEVPVAPQLKPNSPQYDWEAHVAIGPRRIAVVYTSYVSQIFAAFDRETRDIVQQRELPFAVPQDVVACGDHFLVSEAASDSIRVSSLSSDGELLVASGSSVVAQYRSAMASNGRNALVTGSGDAALIDCDARTLRPVPVPHHRTFALYPVVAASTDAYLVVRVDDAGLGATIVSADGDIIASTPTLGSATGLVLPSRRIAAASDGTAFLVVWPQGDEIVASRISRTGIATNPVTIGALSGVEVIAAAWNGEQYRVYYDSDSSPGGKVLLEQRVTAAGEPIGEPSLVEGGGERKRDVAAASSDGTTFVAWTGTSRCGAGTDIFAAWNGSPILVSRGVADDLGPALAATRSGTALAWSERTDTTRVRLTLRSETYEAPSSGAIDQRSPSLTTDGDDVLAAWMETRADTCETAVAAAPLSRFDTAHMVADSVDTASAPALAWNGNDYAIIWPSDQNGRLMAARVSRGGERISEPFPITPEEASEPYTTYRSWASAIVWTGDGYLVVRERVVLVYIPLHSPPPRFDVRLLRLGPDLHPLGAETVIAAGHMPSIAWSGGEALMLWRAEEGTLFGARISPSGDVRAQVTLSANSPQTATHVTWTGSVYLVTVGSRVVQVAQDGTVISAADVLASDAQNSVAAAGAGGIVFAYQKPIDRDVHRVVSVRAAPARRRIVR